jgi:cell division protein FtsB
MESDREADRLLLQETEQELFGLKDKLTQATEQLTTLEATNNELKAENLSLCGHKNSKQKIAMTMTLKKGALMLLEKQLGECADKDHKTFHSYSHTLTKILLFLLSSQYTDYIEAQKLLTQKQQEIALLVAERDAFKQEHRKSKAALKESQLAGTIAGVVKEKRGLSIQNNASASSISASEI